MPAPTVITRFAFVVPPALVAEIATVNMPGSRPAWQLMRPEALTLKPTRQAHLRRSDVGKPDAAIW